MKLEGGSGKRAGTILLAIILALSSLSSPVVANDERECVDLIGVCFGPQLNEDLLVCVTDEKGNAASGATVTVTQGSPRQQTTGSDGCTELEDLSCGDEATVEVSKNSNYWGQDTTTVDCKASEGDSHDHDTYDFQREAPYIVMGSQDIPSQRVDGQTIPFSVKVTHDDEDIDPHDVTVELEFTDSSGFGACTSMDKSEQQDIPRGSEVLFDFECAERTPTGGYKAQFTVITHSYGTQDRTTDQGDERSVDYVPQDDCGKGDDASSSRFNGFSIGFGVSCSGALYELDDTDWYLGSTLKKTTQVSFSTSGSADLCMFPESSSSPTTCGGGFVAPEVQAYDVRATKGSNGDYGFSVSLNEPNDCGTGNDLGQRLDDAPIEKWDSPLLLCSGEVWHDIDERDCVEYEKATDHTIIASAEGHGIPDPDLYLYDDDWNLIEGPPNENRNGRTVLEQDGQVDRDDYFVCIDTSGKMDSDDFPEDWDFSLSWHADCKGDSEWGNADASDEEDNPWPGPPPVEECSAVMADHPDDQDWWEFDVTDSPSDWVSVCEQRGAPVSFGLIDPSGDFHGSFDGCATDDSPETGTYKVGFLGADEPTIYTWVWSAR